MTAPAYRIRVRDVPARAGLDWIRRGLRAFRRQPGGFMGLFALFFLSMLLSALPLALLVPVAEAIGFGAASVQVFGFALLPLLTLGFMIATEAAMNDLRISPAMLFSALAPHAPGRRTLLAIGAAYVAAAVAAAFAGDAFDGGIARGLLVHPPLVTSEADLAALPAMTTGTLAAFACKAAVVALASLPLWFAPALAHWGRQPLMRAMFGSVVALWRTRAAFAVYLLCWIAFWFGASMALGVAISLVALVGNGLLASMVGLSGMWAMSAVFYVTLWFGFVDTFDIVLVPQGVDAPDNSRA